MVFLILAFSSFKGFFFKWCVKSMFILFLCLSLPCNSQCLFPYWLFVPLIYSCIVQSDDIKCKALCAISCYLGCCAHTFFFFFGCCTKGMCCPTPSSSCSVYCQNCSIFYKACYQSFTLIENINCGTDDLYDKLHQWK